MQYIILALLLLIFVTPIKLKLLYKEGILNFKIVFLCFSLKIKSFKLRDKIKSYEKNFDLKKEMEKMKNQAILKPVIKQVLGVIKLEKCYLNPNISLDNSLLISSFFIFNSFLKNAANKVFKKVKDWHFEIRYHHEFNFNGFIEIRFSLVMIIVALIIRGANIYKFFKKERFKNGS